MQIAAIASYNKERGYIMPITGYTTFEGREFSLSNINKILWPRDQYTKGDLIRYYAEIGPYIMKHLKDRPLVFTRYPNGIEGNFFYQKNAPHYMPEWINTFTWTNKDHSETRFVLADETATLVWLANQACIEIHPWLSRKDTPHNPDFIVFDLDPSPESTFEQVKKIAMVIREMMEQFKLRTYVKTSGASGLHIYLPIINKYSYEEVRRFGQSIAELVCKLLPEIATIERAVGARENKIYVDYLQNVLGQTICAPYSVRPHDGAPVSTPVRWEELGDISPKDFTIKNVTSRLNSIGDLFSPTITNPQDITRAMDHLGIIQFN
ncbi:MAG: non-homologous end-joining DNA ligase [Syntrophomonadaceae bacterium]|jgi:bifunctional non-homologous end joining protein LigD